MLEEFTELIPQELKDKSGSVFYSGKNAFKGNKDLYILGINPGGSEILQENETVAWHTKKVLEIDNANWSEYKDEIWKGTKPGNTGLQPRVLHLLNQLNVSPYEVPASNVCFVRSPREKNISKFLNTYAELCWPFHQKIIDELNVKVVLCFGQSAGDIVRKKLGASEKIDEFIETNRRNWKTRVFKNKKGQIVISATHPSRADWTNPDSDPSPLVKKYLR
ncbi:Uracil DNA glycosylase superfamily protein [Lutibacter oricola]|uniref:Uracil DNA glycosylase superfamily protein n=1 Tax=Lutibacter oricola TaxID=762486 RepID=A0A1H3CLZ3_9FLAO|nr:hypothetical protein [Lutibacter oricola]SDX55106.1 Uracil DNA glycosylase superfamily protein [Lutibacter oricola]